ncbi:MAG: hypothetical protein JXQ71_05390 [Verrucomicrobia bacterium]|nr:hypothetical protein [Verrucomicrobiota bacterium]
MTEPTVLRGQCAAKLAAGSNRAGTLRAFIGLDGFVDQIMHVVDKRESADSYQRMLTIGRFAERMAAAAGKSTNIELVNKLTKLGGNGPIMGNALSNLSLKVTYLGNLGYPNLHPVFGDFAKRAEVFSIAEPGYTDALEFDDGKVMVGKHQSLRQVTWENIQTRFGVERFAERVGGADLVAFVNWTMLPHMSEVWTAVLREVCPVLQGRRRLGFFDLCDPEKRTPKDIMRALDLIGQFERYFDVVLGLNEKESQEIGKVLGLDTGAHDRDGLVALARAIRQRVPVNTVLVHPTTYALAVTADGEALVDGPFEPKPLITTGAGDHFNSGFCLGKLLGLDIEESLLCGVTTSGFYVRHAQSPTIDDLAHMMRHWPAH